MTIGYTATYEATYGSSLGFLSFDPVLSRVRVDLATLRAEIGSDDTATIQRSTDGVRWTTIRGGTLATVTAASLPLDDYEFTDAVPNLYQALATTMGPGGAPAPPVVYADAITPDLGGTVWLKNLRFPFLNMPVTVATAGDITRASRGATFDVIGRTLPVAVTTTRGGRVFELTVATTTDTQTAALAGLFASGDVILLQTPAAYPVPLGGYYAAGDLAETRNGVPWQRRWFSVTLTEAAAPDAAVTGSTIIWQGVIDAYGSWNTLTLGEATWTAVLQEVGAPADTIVS